MLRKLALRRKKKKKKMVFLSKKRVYHPRLSSKCQQTLNEKLPLLFPVIITSLLYC